MPKTTIHTGILFDRIEQFAPEGSVHPFAIIPIARPDGTYSTVVLDSDGDTSNCWANASTVEQAIALTKEQMVESSNALWDFLTSPVDE